jgi:formate dehydrogenase major subunit
MSAAPVTLTIDDRTVSVPAGTTIWEAARENGIDIPALCHSPRLRPVGVCRMCVVDVGGRVLAASCVRPCEDGMAVHTATEKVEKQRKVLTALLLADHPVPCAKELTTKDDELDALGRRYGLISEFGIRNSDFQNNSVTDVLLRETSIHTPQSEIRNPKSKDLSSPVIAVDHQACILCDRCVRACDEVQCNEVIGRTGKGYATRIGFDLDNPMGKSTCVSCGECVAACPTGALTNKTITLPLRPRDETKNVASVCPYCGVGCAITYHVAGDRILWAEGREEGGNEGRLCVKGRYGWDYTTHAQRLTKPLIRRKEYYPKGPLSREVQSDHGPGKNGVVNYAEVMPAFREASWDEALDLVAQNLLRIKTDHGPGALAGFGSAKCSNEEAYLFQKLLRAGLGTNNVDHCTRLCHASSVAALLEGIGSGAVTDIFADAKHADFLLLTGTNTTVNHPVAATFFKQAVKRGTKLLVVDPRRPGMADFATWYCPIAHGTDVAFYNALMHVIVAEGLVNADYVTAHTENFDALKELVAKYDPERVAPICGIPAETLRDIARAVGRSRNLMAFWGMGISQHVHGTDNARCLIALCLLTGNVGRPGTGLHPLRGQNNVQGASDAGLIPMMYPDYQLVRLPENREKFEKAWGVPLDPQPGLTVTEIIGGALVGTVKGMYMLGENPFLSDPNINKVRKALAHLDFLAVQDIFLTETAEFADVVLPASTFFEKTGTYTNTDRRVQLGQPALPTPGEARQDWEVICAIADRVGYPMNYASPAEVFTEFAALAPSYHGLAHDNLGPTGKIWPCPDPEKELGELVLFGDHFPTPSGRAKFVPCEFSHAKDMPDDEFPMVLNTGRVLEHWHTGTMTRRSHALDALQPGPFAEVHPDDLTRHGMADGQEVTVRSRRGQIRIPVRSSTKVQPGSVFIPFHFREAAANVLTSDAIDPYGKIPEFKFCAVRLEKD